MPVKYQLDKLIAQKMIDENRQVSLVEISKATGITQSRLIAIRKNRARTVNVDTIEALCKFFDCTPGDLIGISAN